MGSIFQLWAQPRLFARTVTVFCLRLGEAERVWRLAFFVPFIADLRGTALIVRRARLRDVATARLDRVGAGRLARMPANLWIFRSLVGRPVFSER